jgi:hypothetical protein
MNYFVNGMLIVFYFYGFYIFLYNIYSNYLFINDEANLLDDLKSEDDEIEEKQDNKTNEENKSMEKIKEIPYEEKYLTQMRKMLNEYIFTEEELKKEEENFIELIAVERNKLGNSILEIKNNIQELNLKLSNLNNNECLDEEEQEDEQIESEDDCKIVKTNKKKDEKIMEQLEKTIKNDIENYLLKLKELEETKLDEEDLKKKARQLVIDEQLKKYKNCFVIDKTPLGNVLMFYNHDKLAFEYYSDVTIPYRFLETVARKYVVTFNYRPLYIDMEEELKNYEKKLEEIEIANKEKERQLEETKKMVSSCDDKENKENTNKKNVFAKFKTYNKEAGTGKVNTAPPPKNSIPQNRLPTVNINENKQEKLLLKERSNRYSYQGKFSNFNILQKIDRKKVDKKYALTFSEFKKLKMNNKI